MFPEDFATDWDPGPLREALAAAGYRADNFKVADAEGGSYAAVEPSAALDRALKLFAHGRTLAEEEVRSLLGGETGRLVGLGLLSRENGGMRAVVRLDPDGDSVFASDHPERLASGDARDFTMGIGRSTRLLAALAPVRPGLRALDLCTGAGWIALRLAEAGCEVTATDLSPRALAFARLNARLAGRGGLEFLRGSGLEPVAGRRFDLIVANPPFVISPESTYVFRDSGAAGASFCEELARQLPDFLEEDGIAVMLLSWFDGGDDSCSDSPLDALEAKGCGRWLFRNLTQTPEEYAIQWLTDSAAGRTPEPDDLRRWTDHFQTLGAERLHTGFLVIHRSAGPGWRRADARRIANISRHAGGDVRRVVDGEGWLAACRPGVEMLLETCFGVPDGLRTESVATLEDGWRPLSIRLISPARLAYDGNVDAHLLELLARCRRGLPPSSMLAEIGSGPHLPPPEVLRERIAGLVRELIRHGLLLPPV